MSDHIVTPTYIVTLPTGVTSDCLYYTEVTDEFGWAMPDIDIAPYAEKLHDAGWTMYRRPFAPFAMMLRPPMSAVALVAKEKQP